jgi:hypothetical protein
MMQIERGARIGRIQMGDEFKWLMRANVKPGKQGPGSTKKVLIDESGSHEVLHVVRLEIASYGPDNFYLFHVPAEGTATETLHETLEDALDEAEADYGVGRADWRGIP